MRSYLFYDTETTGLNEAFDQIVQFAAIRTDPSLQEVGRYEIRIRLRPDVIPSPGALLTHNISVLDLMSGQCEYEAIQKIHRLVNEPGTVSVGYNSLSFDDKMLRFAFYRNLLPPYTHQYANGCGRLDLFPIAVMYWLYHRNALSWPDADGQVSFRLEQLNQANQLATGPAHDAVADVEATVELARRLRQHEEAWRHYTCHFDRSSEGTRMQQLSYRDATDRGYKAFAVSWRYGSGENYQRPVLYLGRSEAYSNQTLWLRLDLPDLARTSSDTIAQCTQVIRKKPGDGVFLLPVTQANSRLSQERLEIVTANKRWLAENPALRRAIGRFHRHYRYPEIPNLDADAALYQNGFFGEGEPAVAAFHAASLSGKVRLLEEFNTPATRELALRLLARNYDLADYFPAFAAYMKRVNPPDGESALQDYRRRSRLTPRQALLEIEQRKQAAALNPEQLKVLNELETFIKRRWLAVPPNAICAGAGDGT